MKHYITDRITMSYMDINTIKLLIGVDKYIIVECLGEGGYVYFVFVIDL